MQNIERMRLLITQKVNPEMTELILRRIDDRMETYFLAAAGESQRASLLESADVVLTMNVRREIKPEEISLLKRAQLLQSTLAGADGIPFDKLDGKITVCSNSGAYSDPIAEHAIGMMLALARNFLPLHNALSKGVFEQKVPHKMLGGAKLGIVGYGGIGRRAAEIARGFGMKILAINRSGKTNDPVEFAGTLDNLDHVLQDSDFLLLSVSLNNRTRSLIGDRELKKMKPDAVLVNVARGDLVDEKSLYDHLKSNPEFKAGIEAWWIEPFNHPKFEIHYPFFELDNVLGSPHNSFLTKGIYLKALDLALDNVLRFARNEPLRNVQRREDYIPN